LSWDHVDLAVPVVSSTGVLFDGNDDPQYEKVEFMPFLMQSVPAKQQSVGSFKALFRGNRA